MASPSPNSCLVRFGEFELDLFTREFWCNGKRQTLPPQQFQVLQLLIENRGHLVTRETLVAHLWPAGTFVDYEQGLKKAINRLREALHDTAEHPRFIETLPRMGYRFVGTVETETDTVTPPGRSSGAEAKVTGPTQVIPSHQRWWKRTIIIAMLVLVLALNIVLGWWLRRPSAKQESPQSHVIRSVAVLPLENLSGDSDQAYFADGMTDELLTNLAMLSNLRVISRTSAMQYKGTRKAMPTIARELQVDAVVEGSVVRSADRVRIRVQLIDARDDRHLWAAAYECDLKDVLQTQASAAREIASQLDMQLSAKPAIAARAPISPAAHELYLKGRYFWNKRNEASLNKALGYFQQAIAENPSYAEAYAGLADCYVLLAGYAPVAPPQALENAKAAAEKALYLDDSLAEAHASLAILMPYFGWNWAEAQKHYQRAIALNPNYATAHHWYGDAYLAQMGKLDDAIAEIRKAQELDPLSVIIATDIGKNLIFARRYDEAIAQLHKAIELDQGFGVAHFWMYWVYTETGNFPEAQDELDKSMSFVGPRRYLAEKAFLLARSGKRDAARTELKRYLVSSGNTHVNPAVLSYVYCALGDKENAFRWLERAYAERNSFITSIKIVAALDSLHGDPRFEDLSQRMGLPR